VFAYVRAGCLKGGHAGGWASLFLNYFLSMPKE